ncbi:MAG: tRNA preQ1(34) S-adenosylmethionine ribosyltransferase-isomerase QueA, partial [Proteobacteria bacterium]|nr:tRNA preQ1(34) S-adenosylmethionine ribosyltransferase-isomerase QueA [Pseudomonadota bacterium]
MKISDIIIPEKLIAQYPLIEREKCRLLYLNKNTGTIRHMVFENIPSLLQKEDLVVFNNSKVVKARFDGVKSTGGRVELFLIRPVPSSKNFWHCLIKGKNLRKGAIISIGESDVKVEVESHDDDGTFVVRFDDKADIFKIMEEFGRLPLPPYIKRMPNIDDGKYYQTVFASAEGSVAAPTAALHFTQDLIDKIKVKGVKIGFVTLHVGYGTFSMIRDMENHIMHDEFYSVPGALEREIKECKKRGSKIWAVGTTTIRTLETAFDKAANLCKPMGFTDVFIKPEYEFKIVDAIVTNFHHPETTLIYLVSAFAGVDNIVCAYKEAVDKEYRLLSYGDAMV